MVSQVALMIVYVFGVVLSSGGEKFFKALKFRSRAGPIIEIDNLLFKIHLEKCIFYSN